MKKKITYRIVGGGFGFYFPTFRSEESAQKYAQEHGAKNGYSIRRVEQDIPGDGIADHAIDPLY